MYEIEHASARQRNAGLIAEAQRHRLAAQARKLRKRDGRSEYAEAGDHRPPAVDR
jgi:hypothetical protein